MRITQPAHGCHFGMLGPYLWQIYLFHLSPIIVGQVFEAWTSMHAPVGQQMSIH